MASESAQTSIRVTVHVAGVTETLRRTRGQLVKVLEDLPAEELSWRPDIGVNSAANLAWHLARFEESLVGRVLLGRSIRRDIAAEFRDHGPRDPSFYLEELARVRAVSECWLEKATDGDLMMERDSSGPWGDRAFDLFHFLSHHDVHHRAQIIVLRKMIDPSRSFPDLA